jgi:hypothetical protein
VELAVCENKLAAVKFGEPGAIQGFRDDTVWEAARPWEEQWESLGTDVSKWEEQELNDDDRRARFWRRRPSGFAVNEKEHIIYVLHFERVSDAGDG